MTEAPPTAETGGLPEGRPFADGEPVLLFDEKHRKYLLHLRSDGVFSYHNGTLAHSELIGLADGATILSSNGSPLIAVRPRLADYILKMKRGAQVVYPKEIGAILMYADIHPGLTVLEAGTGSGALTMALTRAVGPTGRVVSVEVRDDHARIGRCAMRSRHNPWQLSLLAFVGATLAVCLLYTSDAADE